jgi:hypothetical protein
MSKILIVDPLTLLGQEVLQLLPADLELPGPVVLCHTADDDEHQITDIAGEPALVPPLTEPDELSDADVIVVTSDAATGRAEMIDAFLRETPAMPAVVVGASPHLDALTVPAASGSALPDGRRVRVAHPSLVVAHALVDCLGDMAPARVTIAAIEPVSVGGRDEVERLARQGAQRLQGADVDETIGGHVLAFSAVATDADRLNRDAAMLFPDLAVAATRVLSGCFHGHQTHVSLEFGDPVDRHEVTESLRADDRLRGPDLPVPLDQTTDSDRIALSAPSFSNDDRTMAITAMADGLRIGGALTALEILRALTRA